MKIVNFLALTGVTFLCAAAAQAQGCNFEEGNCGRGTPIMSKESASVQCELINPTNGGSVEFNSSSNSFSLHLAKAEVVKKNRQEVVIKTLSIVGPEITASANIGFGNFQVLLRPDRRHSPTPVFTGKNVRVSDFQGRLGSGRQSYSFEGEFETQLAHAQPAQQIPVAILSQNSLLFVVLNNAQVPYSRGWPGLDVRSDGANVAIHHAVVKFPIKCNVQVDLVN